MGAYFVTCNSVGVYKHALTRGKQYEIIDKNEDKYRIVGDHGKQVWIDQYYFVLEPVLQMIDWKLDDDINEWKIVEVTITFNDGSRRWLNMTTPQNLLDHFGNSMMDPPGMTGEHMIIMKSLEIDVIEVMLRYLDSQGELERQTIPLEDEFNDDKDFA